MHEHPQSTAASMFITNLQHQVEPAPRPPPPPVTVLSTAQAHYSFLSIFLYHQLVCSKNRRRKQQHLFKITSNIQTKGEMTSLHLHTHTSLANIYMLEQGIYFCLFKSTFMPFVLSYTFKLPLVYSLGRRPQHMCGVEKRRHLVNVGSLLHHVDPRTRLTP